MAVQIPQGVKRLDAPDAPSVGRTDFKPIDVTQAYQAQQGALNKLAETGLKVYEQREKFTADTEGTKAATEYHQYLEDGLNGPKGVKRVEGDPAPAFDSFNKSAEEKRKEILARYADASDRVRQSVEQNIAVKDAKFYDQKITAFGTMQESYQKKVFGLALKQNENQMAQDAVHVDVKDPASLDPVRVTIENTRQKVIESGLQNGTVAPVLDKDGKTVSYRLSPIAQNELNSSVSKGLQNAIQTLRISGDVEGARYVSEEFKEYLVNEKPAIQKALYERSVEVQALRLSNSVRNLPEDVALQKIENETKGDSAEVLEVRQKAIANLRTDTNARKDLEKDQIDKNFGLLSQKILTTQGTPNRYVDYNAFKNDPSNIPYLDKVNKDPHKIKTLQQMFVQKEISEPGALDKAYTALANQEFRGMSYEVLNSEYLVDLSAADRKKITSKWESFNSQSPSENNKMYKDMEDYLKTDLLANGYLKMSPIFAGKLTPESAEKFNKARREYIERIDGITGNPSIADRQKISKDYAAKLKAGDLKSFNLAAFTPKFQGKITPKDVPPNGVSAKPLTDEEQKVASKLFRETKQFPTYEQIRAYINKNGQ